MMPTLIARIELPIPVPTWNVETRLNPGKRMRLKKLTHSIVDAALSGSPITGRDLPIMITCAESISRIPSSLIASYMMIIRPSCRDPLSTCKLNSERTIVEVISDD